MNLNISNQIKNFTSRLQSDTDLLSYEGLIKKKTDSTHLLQGNTRGNLFFETVF